MSFAIRLGAVLAVIIVAHKIANVSNEPSNDSFELLATYVSQEFWECHPMFAHWRWGDDDYCIIVKANPHTDRISVVASVPDTDGWGERVGLSGTKGGPPISIAYPGSSRYLLIYCHTDGSCTVRRGFDSDTLGTIYAQNRHLMATQREHGSCYIMPGAPRFEENSAETAGAFLYQENPPMMLWDGDGTLIPGFGYVQCARGEVVLM